MKKTVLTFLHRYRWFLLAASALVLALWIFVVGFGDDVGLNPKVIHAVEATLGKIWAGLVVVVQALILKDSDGDGIPDPVDADPDDPEIS